MSEAFRTPFEPDATSRLIGPSPPFEICAKGISFRSFLSALEQLRGEAAVTRSLEHVPDELQEALKLGRIDANAWHPVSWLRELHRAAQTVTGEGPALSRLIGYESVRHDFNGPLRALAFVLSPQALVRRGPRIFRTYYRPGEMYVLDSRPGRLRAHWSGCSGFDANLWQDALGGCEAVLKVCGARHVELQTLSGAGEHDSRAEVMVRWY